MAGEQDFSPSKSMDEKKDQCPQKSDEVWSELHNPYGKEFNLPNLSNPLSSDASDNNADLADSTFDLFDVPIAIDETILQGITDPSCGRNPTESLQALEKQKGLLDENNLFDVPIFDGISFNLEVNDFLRGQKPDLFDMFDLPSSFTSCYQEINPTNGHVSAGQSKSILVSPNKPLPGSNDFTFENPAFFSSTRNEAARDPITNTTYVGPLTLNHSALTMEIPVIIPTPRVTQTQSAPSNFFGNCVNGQTFGLSPFQVGQSSSNVSGENGNLTYAGSSGAFGGTVSFHENLVTGYSDPEETNTEGNGFSIQGKGKEKISTPWAQGDDSEEIEWGQACKRLKRETSEQDNVAENVSSGEASSSSPSLLRDILRAFSDLDDIPSRGALRQS